MSSRQQTFFVSEVVTGPSGGGPSGTNKDMVTLLNPASSGKYVKLIKLMVQAVTSSGTNVMVEYEFRRITAHTGGTTITPSKRDLADVASSAQVRTSPTSVTGATRVWTHVFQSNTAQSPNSYEWRFGDMPFEDPFIFAEGEGVSVHQVTSNGGTFAITLVWIEE